MKKQKPHKRKEPTPKREKPLKLEMDFSQAVKRLVQVPNPPKK